MNKNKRIVLPSTIIPSKYRLSLIPNMTDFTYSGKVIVDLHAKQPVNQIKLHSADLEFKNVEFSQSDHNKKIDVSKISFDSAEETAEIPTTVSQGDGTLKIEFSGLINDQMKGFYRSTFKDATGKSRVVGCTQFEPIDARRAFPCWDEPVHKAKFDVDITVPQKYLVLSNMEGFFNAI
ncbi:Aminopeptidase 2 mitochondrial, variant 2 [Bonamia ostreae]